MSDTVMTRSSASPLVSIIVLVYNTAPYLAKCLESVLAQTLKDIEIIVVDDGSTDDSPALCDAYAAQDVRVRVIHQDNKGRSAARNCGVAAAKGTWIGFVDSDDWIEPTMYDSLLTAAQKHDALVAICGRVEEHEGHSDAIAFTGCDVLSTDQAIEELLHDTEVRSYLCDKLFYRTLFEGIKFPIGRNFEDVAVVYQLFLKSERIAFTPNMAYHYAFHGSNIVTEESLSSRIDYWLAAKERFDVLVQKYPCYAKLLELDVMRTNLICWSLAWGAKGHDADMFKRFKHEMALFAKGHNGCLLKTKTLGWVGRFCARLTISEGQWAFFVTRWLGVLRNMVRLRGYRFRM